jgi:hypothetical protein
VNGDQKEKGRMKKGKKKLSYSQQKDNRQENPGHSSLFLATTLGAVGVPGAVAPLVGPEEVLVECRVRALESWHDRVRKDVHLSIIVKPPR